MRSAYSRNGACGEPLERRRLFAATAGYVAVFSGDEGSRPIGGVVRDAAGNLYGVNRAGGNGGLGVVYQLAVSPNNFYNFVTVKALDATTGGTPAGGLYIDGTGDLFGTTTTDAAGGNGTIFEISAAGAFSTLATFDAATTGQAPQGSLVADAGGNLFGVTHAGGANGLGTTFELPKTATGFGTLGALASFAAGSSVVTGPTIDPATGTLYGVSATGGANTYGYVYRAGPSDGYVVHDLYEFQNGFGNDGYDPTTTPVLDATAANLYGTTGGGGGSAWKIALAAGAFSVVHPFLGSVSEAAYPNQLAIDAAGNLFGSNASFEGDGADAIFEIPAGQTTPTVLTGLGTPVDGPVTFDGFGNLYAEQPTGGYNGGDGGVVEYGSNVPPRIFSESFYPLLKPATAVANQVSPTLVVAALDADSGVVPAVEPIVTVKLQSGPAGGTVTGTTTVQAVDGRAAFSDLTFTAPGTYVLTSLDANNVANSFPVTVTVTPGGGVTPTPAPTPTPGGSLTPSILRFQLPTALVAGMKTKGSFAVQLKNAGTAGVKGTAVVALYATTAGVIDGTSVLLASVNRGVNLKAGRSITVTVPVKKVPDSLNGGYTIVARATDPTLATSDAATASVVDANPPFVQLFDTARLAPNATVVPGRSTSVLVTLTNTGNVDAAGLATLALGYSNDLITVTPIATQRRALRVKANGAVTIRVAVKIPKTAQMMAGILLPAITATLAGQTVGGIVGVGE